MQERGSDSEQGLGLSLSTVDDLLPGKLGGAELYSRGAT